MNENVQTIKAFKGVNNVTDSHRLSQEWLIDAVNVNVTNTNGIVRRGSATSALATTVDGSYESEDGRVFIVSSGALRRVMPDLTTRTLTTGLTSDGYYWAEINNQIYFGNGTSYGIIERDDSVSPLLWDIPTAPTLRPHNGSMEAGMYRCCVTYVMPDGRETGPSEPTELVLGGSNGLLIEDIPQVAGWGTNVYITPVNSTVFMLAGYTTQTAMDWNIDMTILDEPIETMDDYPIRGTRLTVWQGQLFTAEQEGSTSTIWASEALQPHLFPRGDSHLTVPGEVTLMCAGSEGLIIGTRERIYAWNGETLIVLAEYGAPSSEADTDSSGTAYFMTNKGLCKAFPFQNLTEQYHQFTLWDGLRVSVLEDRDELRVIITGG
jgi:hypothetical protein